MKRCVCCGCEIDDIDARSSKDHRRFFKIVHVAYHHWPEGHDFQPASAEHLRAWLLCKADWKTVTTYQLPATDSPIQMAAFIGLIEDLLGDEDNPRFGRWVGSSLHVFKPKSIKYTRAGQKRFNKVRDAVSEIIEAEIGIPVETLLRESEKAA